MNGRLTDLTLARAFILSGDARVTFVSVKTGARFTYRVHAADGEYAHRPRFVSLLSGADNTSDYAFFGTLFHDEKTGGWTFRHGKPEKTRIRPDAPGAVAFTWAWRQLGDGKLPDTLEVWHEGRCGKCGRVLTTPASIATGIGPVCSGR